jgi:ferritin-like protein
MERHRAIVSLMEEFEAVDWYDQRIDATTDEALREILRHNRDEEMEHASMLLEWLRRREPKWDVQLRHYLFREGPIMSLEGSSAEGAARPSGSLGIGSLREKEDL